VRWRPYDRLMARQRFTGKLEAGRGGGAFVVLPDKILDALGGGSRFRVKGALNGVNFSSSTMGMGGGRVCMGVHKATREAAGVGIGEKGGCRGRTGRRAARVTDPC
jgi:hypothetical protein